MADMSWGMKGSLIPPGKHPHSPGRIVDCCHPIYGTLC